MWRLLQKKATYPTNILEMERAAATQQREGADASVCDEYRVLLHLASWFSWQSLYVTPNTPAYADVLETIKGVSNRGCAIQNN